jgi:hypothetical protein
VRQPAQAGRRDELISIRQNIQVQFPNQQPFDVLKDIQKPMLDLIRLLLLPPVKGDRFRILPNSHQAKPEICFLLELFKVESDKRLTKDTSVTRVPIRAYSTRKNTRGLEMPQSTLLKAIVDSTDSTNRSKKVRDSWVKLRTSSAIR